ncbi:hypothetical protein [Clostridium sp. UBA6640]|uniref:hypothetical protein n=1 Tax=Clostridium sp. UBA6640 TaxID=1946370 RepID=UPI0025C2BC72|nr:hypothetical protein [Clostridium sp. UBA6640]
MKRKVAAMAVIGILIIVLTGCIVKNQSSAHYIIEEGHKIADTYYYDVEDDFEGMKLEIDLTLTKGKVKFELKDPNGNIQWNGEVTSDKSLKETKDFDKISGKWTLTFENIDNSGEGKLNLQFNRL